LRQDGVDVHVIVIVIEVAAFFLAVLHVLFGLFRRGLDTLIVAKEEETF
jgi:hypothetical protein